MGNQIQCPKCRSYSLERKWCDVCDGKGTVDSEKRDKSAELLLSKELVSSDEKLYIVNGKEQKERPRCAIRGCERFADSPWTTCQEHWR